MKRWLVSQYAFIMGANMWLLLADAHVLDFPFHHHAALHVIFVGVAGYVLALLHNDMI